MPTLLFLILLLTAYLVGSVCSAVIVSRLFSLPDPCLEGSKNPGATNVMRLAGAKYAIIVLLGDMLKGLLPVLLANWLGLSPFLLGFICLAAILGHLYPIFFGFKGGKGVATALGALLGFHWLLGVMVLVTWLIVALISRYSSLSSIIAIILAPAYAWLVTGDINSIWPLFIITAIVLYKHQGNIMRLIHKQEPKIKLKSK